MKDFLAWLDKPFATKVLDSFLLVAIVGVLLFFLYLFLKYAPKSKNTVKVTKDGIEAGAVSEDGESSTPTVSIVQNIDKGVTDPKVGILMKQIEELKKEVECMDSDDDRIPLSQHTVFNLLKNFIERGIDLAPETVEKCSPEKLKINRIFLDIKFTTVYDGLRDWINTMEKFDESTPKDLINKELYGVVDRIYAWIDEYNHKAKIQKIFFTPVTYIEGIPDMYIEKFDEWHKGHIDTIFTQIDKVIHGDFYPSWRLRVILVLEHLETSLRMTKGDAERTLNQLNGTLEDKIKKEIRHI